MSKRDHILAGYYSVYNLLLSLSFAVIGSQWFCRVRRFSRGKGATEETESQGAAAQTEPEEERGEDSQLPGAAGKTGPSATAAGD